MFKRLIRFARFVSRVRRWLASIVAGRWAPLCYAQVFRCLAILDTASAICYGQGYGPEVAASKMTVPPGFEVRLAACEPLIRQPVAIDFDSRGRLWVLQYLQYPNPEGLKRVAWDRFSRTKYDRVPEPPPRGPRGGDKLTILEDTDGDGRMDRGRDFLDGLNLASGFAFGHGGVFVLQVPYLLFYADANGDDLPDGDPEVLLTGFGMEDAHSVANSLTWGPDGWLYGAQGSTVTANIRGIEFQQGVWRYHPLTKAFELFYEGGGNTWGVDFDEQGNLFASTNFGPFVMLHGVQGGYYWKSFGKHGALHNPFAYGFFEHVPQDVARGGHVTDGGFFYTGVTFPGVMRGKYIANNLLSHEVHWHELSPEASSFRAKFAGALLESNDAWFAPSDATQGPDGAVYVADWHDQRTAHPDPDADWDRSNGRVYRIQAVGAQPAPVSNVSELSGDALFDLIGHENGWLAQRVRGELAKRRGTAVAQRLRRALLDAAADGIDSHKRLEMFWAHYVSAGMDDELALRLLADEDAAVRRWAVRLAGDAPMASPAVAATLDHMAETEPDATVRSQLMCTARRLPVAQAMPILNATMLRSVDTLDPHIPLLLWWAIERHAVDGLAEVQRRFNTAAAWNVPLKRDVVLPRLARRWTAADKLDAVEQLLSIAPDPQAARLLAQAISLGWAERAAGTSGAASGGTVGIPPSLAVLIEKYWHTEPNDSDWLRLAVRVGLPGAEQHALATATNSINNAEVRLASLTVLHDAVSPETPRQLLAMIAPEQSAAIQLAALGALGRWDDAEVAQRLLATYDALKPDVQSRVRDVLLARPGSARLILDEVASEKIDRKSVPLEQARQALVHDDPAIKQLVRTLWGNLTSATNEEKLAEIRRLNNDVRAAAGDRLAGHALFKKHCAVCHELFGEGGKVGPELTTGNRKDRQFVLTSLVDPSGVIRKEYVSHAVHTTDGRVLSGLIVAQDAARITLRDAKAQDTAIAQSDVETIEESPVSMMPENLYRELKPQELRDLFSYLEGEGRPTP